MLCLGFLNNRKKKLDRVAATNRVLGAFKVPCEVVEILCLDKIHALAVKTLNRAMDHRLVIELVSESKSLAPVAKVTRNYKESSLIYE